MNQNTVTQKSWLDWLENTSSLDELNWQVFSAWLYGVEHEEDAVRRFDAAFFQQSPSQYQTERVHVLKSHHHYGNYFQAEMLSLSASRPLCTVLAMLALQAVFSAKSVELSLTHADSGIQKIYFEVQDTNYPLEMKAVAWHYELEPFKDYLMQLREQQVKFSFCLSGEDFARQGHWLEDRNQLYCMGTAQELTAWAGTLLNMAHADNHKDEVGFESDVGFGGVHTGSAELYLYLPSSLGYALDDTEYTSTATNFSDLA